jgi:hypothetical protein
MLPVVGLAFVLLWAATGHVFFLPLLIVGFFWFRAGRFRHHGAGWDYGRPPRTEIP